MRPPASNDLQIISVFTTKALMFGTDDDDSSSHLTDPPSTSKNVSVTPYGGDDLATEMKALAERMNDQPTTGTD